MAAAPYISSAIAVSTLALATCAAPTVAREIARRRQSFSDEGRNLRVHGIDLELTREGIKDGAQQPEFEKTMAISLFGARSFGFLEGFRRGFHGGDGGAVARKWWSGLAGKTTMP
uniref:Dirigent protein n=1 Tax=Oryza nivara TaxID=4536 RepID=A0A0E0FL02_ORYNI